MKRKVLVVDDNPKNLQVVAALLAENDYQVEVAISGEAALMWLTQTKFDTILLDVMMPDMDGFETCEKIRKDASNDNIPIIFLTARQDIESITEGFRVGGVDYLTKPFNHDELLARLATHIELKVAREKMSNLNQWLENEVDKKTIELKEANAELERANAELRQLDVAKNDFLKAISHEIRTPLNGICGSLTLLKDYSEDEYFKEVISLLDASVNNLEKYSYIALQIANLQIRGDQYLGFQEVDLAQLGNNCLINLAKKAESQNITLSFKTECSESLILADIKHLQGAISTLIESSLSFTKEGYVNMTVLDKENCFVLQVEDSGCLFAGKEVSHYFDSINSQNYQFERNNAIELHLASIIVQLHKGVLVFENMSSKKGTITTIKIPKKTVR